MALIHTQLFLIILALIASLLVIYDHKKDWSNQSDIGYWIIAASVIYLVCSVVVTFFALYYWLLGL